MNGWIKRNVARVVVVIAACLVLIGAGVATNRLLAEETLDARGFVAEGQSALARSDRGSAVLAIERARWLAPRASWVRAATSAANIRDVAPLPVRVLRMVTSREWFILSVTCGWLSALGLALILARKRTAAARWVALTAGVGFVVAVLGVVESSVSSPAVVTGTDARVLVAPYSAAETVAPLPPGTVVVVGPTYSDFVHVEGADGASGWVRRASIERVASGEG